MRKTVKSYNELIELIEGVESETIETLVVESCEIFDVFPKNSFSKIEKLEFLFWGGEAIPADLPIDLKTLRFSFCKNLRAINGALPDNLEELHILNCPKYLSLPKFSSGSVLQTIVLNECGVEILPEDLPATVNKLTIKGCSSLNRLPERVLVHLEHLRISDCKSLKEFGPIKSEVLADIEIKNCANLIVLGELNCSKLKSLRIDTCEKLQSLSCVLPNELAELVIHNSGFRSLPKLLPSKLEKLHLTSCEHVEFLPESLPPNLKNFVFWECPKVSPGFHCGGDLIISPIEADGYHALLYNSSGVMTLSFEYYNGDMDGFHSDLLFYAGTDNEEFAPELEADYLKAINSVYELARSRS